MGLMLREYTLETFKEGGWTRIPGSRFVTDRPEPAKEWCRKNCQWDEWVQFGYDWWFKHERDAVAFKLRWA